MPASATIKRLDYYFSRLVRIRDLWTCQKCGKEYGPGQNGIECSHLIGRANKATRWDPLAAVAHCTRCHFHLGGNPLEFTAWIENYLGPEKMELLLWRARQDVRWTQELKNKLRNEMIKEMKRAEAAAAGGLEWFSPELSTVVTVIHTAAALNGEEAPA